MAVGKSEISTDYRSVLTGGQIPGWTPEVAVVLWRRMLGILGDINSIKAPSIHKIIMEHLLELQTTILKVYMQNIGYDTPCQIVGHRSTPYVFTVNVLGVGIWSGYKVIFLMVIDAHELYRLTSKYSGNICSWLCLFYIF